MIRLGSYRGPDFHNEERVLELRERLYEHLRRPFEERAQRRAPIDTFFFSDDRLVDTIARRARWKCVFCETPEADQVGHFRPIGDSLDLQGEPMHDYYAWLAYDPENMIWLCRTCALNKSMYFPTKAQRAPYLASLAELRRLERPFLIDPYRDQVENHFDFLMDGWCEPLTDEGRVTVDLLQLNRPGLIAQREDAFMELVGALAKVFTHEYPDDLAGLFEPGWPFLGGRLNILKRIVRNLDLGLSRAGGAKALPNRLAGSWHNLDREARARLATRARELGDQDSQRQRYEGGGPRNVGHQVPVYELGRPRRTGGISKIQLSNFRGIRSLELRTKEMSVSRGLPCLMILGENAVGKSSVLQAIALALIGEVDARRLRLDAGDIWRNADARRWDQLRPEPAVAQVEFAGDFDPAYFILHSARARISGDAPRDIVVLGYGPRRFFDPKRTRQGTGGHSLVQTLFKPIATIPYPGTWLNELSPHEFDEVAQVLRIVLALDESDELVRDIDSRICIRLAGVPVPVERLSEGYRSVFVMVADIARNLLQRYPSLAEAEAFVLIDEIETHLHPRWKMRVMPSLRRAFPAVQFICTTHDPLCLRGMDDGEVIVLERDEDGQVREMTDLPSVKGMRADQLLTSDFFGLSSTVDPETELELARFVDGISSPDIVSPGATRLVSQLVLGNDAQEQIIHEALRRFNSERERQGGRPRTKLRAEAVQAVLNALRISSGDPQ